MFFFHFYEDFVAFREWIDGSFGKVDPDTVEQDIGNLWRGLYKLEKTFAENPNAKMIAEKVCTPKPFFLKSLFCKICRSFENHYYLTSTSLFFIRTRGSFLLKI